MSKTVHSVKLVAYDAVDLNRLSYSNGDLVYDNTNSTVRVMNGISAGGISLASQAWTTAKLNSYVTTSSLTTALTGYVTNTALTTAIGSLVSSTSLTTTLSTYVTSTGLASSLVPYVTTTGLTSTLNTTLSGYATTTALSTERTRATTAEGLLAPIASPTFTGTVTAPTAIIGGVNIKSLAIAMAAALS